MQRSYDSVLEGGPLSFDPYGQDNATFLFFLQCTNPYSFLYQLVESAKQDQKNKDKWVQLILIQALHDLFDENGEYVPVYLMDGVVNIADQIEVFIKEQATKSPLETSLLAETNPEQKKLAILRWYITNLDVFINVGTALTPDSEVEAIKSSLLEEINTLSTLNKEYIESQENKLAILKSKNDKAFNQRVEEIFCNRASLNLFRALKQSRLDKELNPLATSDADLAYLVDSSYVNLCQEREQLKRSGRVSDEKYKTVFNVLRDRLEQKSAQNDAIDQAARSVPSLYSNKFRKIASAALVVGGVLLLIGAALAAVPTFGGSIPGLAVGLSLIALGCMAGGFLGLGVLSTVFGALSFSKEVQQPSSAKTVLLELAKYKNSKQEAANPVNSSENVHPVFMPRSRSFLRIFGSDSSLVRDPVVKVPTADGGTTSVSVKYRVSQPTGLGKK